MLTYQVRFQCYGCSKDIYGRVIDWCLTDFSKKFKKFKNAEKFLSKIQRFIDVGETKYSPVSEEEVRFVEKFVKNGYIKQCYGLFKVTEKRII